MKTKKKQQTIVCLEVCQHVVEMKTRKTTHNCLFGGGFPSALWLLKFFLFFQTKKRTGQFPRTLCGRNVRLPLSQFCQKTRKENTLVPLLSTGTGIYIYISPLGVD